MRTQPLSLVSLIAIAASCLGSNATHADVVRYTSSFNTNSNYTVTSILSQFDPSLGVLTSATLACTTTSDLSISVVNVNGAAGVPVTVSLQDVYADFTFQYASSPTSVMTDYTGVPGYSVSGTSPARNTRATLGQFPLTASVAGAAIPSGNVSDFVGTGNISITTNASVSVSFNVSAPGQLGDGADLDQYGAQTVSYVFTPALPGDANGDGKVDLNDLNTVLNKLGTTSSLRSDGNFDGAATIDLNDLNEVLNNLGTALPSSSSLAIGLSPSIAPEPASILMLAFGGTAMLIRHRGSKAGFQARQQGQGDE